MGHCIFGIAITKRDNLIMEDNDHAEYLNQGFWATSKDNIKEGAYYAVVQTDYFGGWGSQKSTAYLEGHVVEFGEESDNAINLALKELGVIKEEGKDEFDTVNLGHYRSNYDFSFLKFEDRSEKFETFRDKLTDHIEDEMRDDKFKFPEFQEKSKSDYVFKIDGNVLKIIDLNLGKMSVTNDAENVLTEIRKEIGDNMDLLSIEYRNSEGIWDKLIPHWEGTICQSVEFSNL